MRRSPAAEHLAAPPVARQQLRTARNALKVCSTVPASDRVRFAAVAPPPEPREATRDCVETKKTHLNVWESESGYRPWSDFALRQSGHGPRRGTRGVPYRTLPRTRTTRGDKAVMMQSEPKRPGRDGPTTLRVPHTMATPIRNRHAGVGGQGPTTRTSTRVRLVRSDVSSSASRILC